MAKKFVRKEIQTAPVNNPAVALGIDTSAYTTSVAVYGAEGLVAEARQILPVPQGQRGLRPSEAVFYHVRHLPRLLEQLMPVITGRPVAVVAASIRPRPLPSSYLPPFTVGEGWGRSLALAWAVPFRPTSHQEGHIQAGLVGAGWQAREPFWALHLSGGTTELLRVTPDFPGFRIEWAGGSDDLYAGQFIDRIGVRLGLPFPAGPQVEALAKSLDGEPAPVPVSMPRLIEGAWRVSFSGPLTAAERLLQQGYTPAQVARGVELALARTISRWIRRATAPAPLLLVGGVAANGFLRHHLRETLPDYSLHVAPPELSRDNAVGVAALGWRSMTQPGED